MTDENTPIDLEAELAKQSELSEGDAIRLRLERDAESGNPIIAGDARRFLFLLDRLDESEKRVVALEKKSTASSLKKILGLK